MRVQYFVWFFLCLAGCGEIKSKVDPKIAICPVPLYVTLTLAPNLVDCGESSPMECMVIEETSNDQKIPEGIFSSPIEGFTFVPGLRQTIEVEILEIAEPSAGSNSRKYNFIRSL